MNTNPHRPDHEEKRREALRAIDRVEAESETIGGSTLARMARRAQDHFGASDKSDRDEIEVLGTRIGRAAGLVFAIGLLVYLAMTYF